MTKTKKAKKLPVAQDQYPILYKHELKIVENFVLSALRRCASGEFDPDFFDTSESEYELFDNCLSKKEAKVLRNHIMKRRVLYSMISAKSIRSMTPVEFVWYMCAVINSSEESFASLKADTESFDKHAREELEEDDEDEKLALKRKATTLEQVLRVMREINPLTINTYSHESRATCGLQVQTTSTNTGTSILTSLMYSYTSDTYLETLLRALREILALREEVSND